MCCWCFSGRFLVFSWWLFGGVFGLVLRGLEWLKFLEVLVFQG